MKKLLLSIFVLLALFSCEDKQLVEDYRFSTQTELPTEGSVGQEIKIVVKLTKSDPRLGDYFFSFEQLKGDGVLKWNNKEVEEFKQTQLEQEDKLLLYYSPKTIGEHSIKISTENNYVTLIDTISFRSVGSGISYEIRDKEKDLYITKQSSFTLLVDKEDYTGGYKFDVIGLEETDQLEFSKDKSKWTTYVGGIVDLLDAEGTFFRFTRNESKENVDLKLTIQDKDGYKTAIPLEYNIKLPNVQMFTKHIERAGMKNEKIPFDLVADEYFDDNVEVTLSVPDNFSGQVTLNNEILIDTEVAPKTRTAVLPSSASVVSKDTNLLEVTGKDIGSFNIQSIGRNRFGVSDTLVNIAKVTNIPNYTFEVEQPGIISDTDICKYTVLFNGEESELPNYPINSELKIKAETLNNDYEFKGWETYDLATSTWRANIETSTTLTITLQEDTKVRAVYAKVPKYDLTLVENPSVYTLSVSINGTVTTERSFKVGTEIQVTTTLINDDWEFKGWKSYSETSTTIDITINSNVTLEPNYVEIPKYNLTLSPRDGVTYKVFANGESSATSSRVFKRGTNLRIEYAITNTDEWDYEFVRWNLGTGGTGTVIGNAVAITSMSQNETLFVETNNIRKYKLTLGSTNYGRYEVYKNNVLTSDRIFRTGTSIKVKTIATNNDWGFKNWSGASTATTAEVTITMNSDKSLTANYVRWRTLTLQNSGGLGNFTKEINGVTTTTATRFLDGTVVKVTSTPVYYNGKTPYTFKNWSGASTGINKITAVAMNSDKTLIANYNTEYSTIRVAGANFYDDAVWYKFGIGDWIKTVFLHGVEHKFPRYSTVNIYLMGQIHDNFSLIDTSSSSGTIYPDGIKRKEMSLDLNDSYYRVGIYEMPN